MHGTPLALFNHGIPTYERIVDDAALLIVLITMVLTAKLADANDLKALYEVALTRDAVLQANREDGGLSVALDLPFAPL
jgi:hypothetical protein